MALETWYDEDESRTKRDKRILYFVINLCLIIFALLVTLGLIVGILTSFGDIIYSDPPVC